MAVRTHRRATKRALSRRPLLITADAELLDDLVRVAESAGVVLDVAPDVESARPWYATAPLILLGIDLAGACQRYGLPRRGGVVPVVRHDGLFAPDWRVADQLRVDHIAALPAAEPWLTDRIADARTDRVGRRLR